MSNELRRAVIAWEKARRDACAAPLNDRSVWVMLGAAETTLAALARSLQSVAEDKADEDE